MTFIDMLYGHYYWLNGELYLCLKVIPISDTNYGSIKLKPVGGTSGGWYSLKYWGATSVRWHNP